MRSKWVFQIRFSNPNLTFQELSLLWHTKLFSPCPSRFLPSPLTEQLHACNASEKGKIPIVQPSLHMQCKEKTVPPGSLCKWHCLWLEAYCCNTHTHSPYGYPAPTAKSHRGAPCRGKVSDDRKTLPSTIKTIFLQKRMQKQKMDASNLLILGMLHHHSM